MIISIMLVLSIYSYLYFKPNRNVTLILVKLATILRTTRYTRRKNKPKLFIIAMLIHILLKAATILKTTRYRRKEIGHNLLEQL